MTPYLPRKSYDDRRDDRRGYRRDDRRQSHSRYEGRRTEDGRERTANSGRNIESSRVKVQPERSRCTVPQSGSTVRRDETAGAFPTSSVEVARANPPLPLVPDQTSNVQAERIRQGYMDAALFHMKGESAKAEQPSKAEQMVQPTPKAVMTIALPRLPPPPPPPPESSSRRQNWPRYSQHNQFKEYCADEYRASNHTQSRDYSNHRSDMRKQFVPSKARGTGGGQHNWREGQIRKTTKIALPSPGDEFTLSVIEGDVQCPIIGNMRPLSFVNQLDPTRERILRRGESRNKWQLVTRVSQYTARRQHTQLNRQGMIAVLMKAHSRPIERPIGLSPTNWKYKYTNEGQPMLTKQESGLGQTGNVLKVAHLRRCGPNLQQYAKNHKFFGDALNEAQISFGNHSPLFHQSIRQAMTVLCDKIMKIKVDFSDELIYELKEVSRLQRGEVNNAIGDRLNAVLFNWPSPDAGPAGNNGRMRRSICIQMHHLFENYVDIMPGYNRVILPIGVWQGVTMTDEDLAPRAEFEVGELVMVYLPVNDKLEPIEILLTQAMGPIRGPYMIVDKKEDKFVIEGARDKGQRKCLSAVYGVEKLLHLAEVHPSLVSKRIYGFQYNYSFDQLKFEQDDSGIDMHTLLPRANIVITKEERDRQEGKFDRQNNPAVKKASGGSKMKLYSPAMRRPKLQEKDAGPMTMNILVNFDAEESDAPAAEESDAPAAEKSDASAADDDEEEDVGTLEDVVEQTHTPRRIIVYNYPDEETDGGQGDDDGPSCSKKSKM